MRTKKNPLIQWPDYPIPQIQLTYNTDVSLAQRPFIDCTTTAGKFLQNIWDKDTVQLQEKFKVMLLSRSHKVLGVYEAAVGGITSTICDPRLIFSASLLANATSIVISHNHPSGSLEPSVSDKCTTEKMIKAGRLLDIDVLDSIIVTKDGYFSFKDAKLIK